MTIQRRGFFTIPITLLLVVGIAIGFQALGALLALAIDPASIKAPLTADPSATLIATGVAQLVVMLIGTILLARLFRQDPFRVFRLRGFYETPPMVYLLAIPLVMSAQFLGSSLTVVWGAILHHIPLLDHSVEKLEQAARDITNGAISNSRTVGQAVVTFVTIAIVPAFSEELLFRGFVQSNIELSGKHRPRPYLALAITSVAFALVHFEPVSFPGLLILGLTLGYMSYRTANLFVGSVGHVANNGVIVLAMMLLPDTAQKSQVGSAILNDSSSAWAGLAALTITLPMFLACLYLFRRATQTLTARDSSHELFEDTLSLSTPVDYSEGTSDHDTLKPPL